MEEIKKSFERKVGRPNVSNIHPEIFLDEGPYPKTCVEIQDNSTNGKITFYMDIIANSVLPESHNNKALPGRDSRVVLISTEHDISSCTLQLYLHRILETYIPICDITKLIDLCVQRLIIIYCKSSYDLKKALNDLTNIVGRNENIGTLIVDSLSSYCWSDLKTEHFNSIEDYNITMKRFMKAQLKDLHIVTYYSIYNCNNHTIFDNSKLTIADYIVVITENSEKQYEFHTTGNTFESRYLSLLTDFSMQWNFDCCKL